MIDYVGIEFKSPNDVYLQRVDEILVRYKPHSPYYALISRVDIIVGDDKLYGLPPSGSMPLLNIAHRMGRRSNDSNLVVYYNKAHFLHTSHHQLVMSSDYKAQFDEYVNQAMPKLINI